MAPNTPSLERLLVEVEDLLNTVPPLPLGIELPQSDEDWLGRAAAVIGMWSAPMAITLGFSLPKVNSLNRYQRAEGFREIRILLRRARHDLRLRTSGPLTIPIGQGRVFEYFDEVRKVLEGAAEEVFFVDPYLDATFVSRYLTQLRPGVSVRLLTSPDSSRLSSLIPAIDLYRREYGKNVEIRSSPKLHDRYLFIDRAEVHQSGASFKDGGKKSGTVLAQIVDAFPAMWQSYAELWSVAKVENA